MNALHILITLLLGAFVFVVLIPHGNREFFYAELRRFARLSQVGGYVHDTGIAQVITPKLIDTGTVGTWTFPAGQVAGTVVAHCAAAAQTAVINIPILIPSNSVAGKGSLLKYVEIDYEIIGLAATSVTLAMVKVVRGADGADAVVSAPAGTQLLTPATTAATLDEHRDRFTLTTPAYIDDDEFYMLKCTIVQAATTQFDFISAVAYFTERL